MLKYFLLSMLMMAVLAVAAEDGIGADLRSEDRVAAVAAVPVTVRQQAMAKFIRATVTELSSDERIALLLGSLRLEPSYQAPLVELLNYAKKPAADKVIAGPLLEIARGNPSNMLLAISALDCANRAKMPEKELFEFNAAALKAVSRPDQLEVRDRRLYLVLLNLYMTAAVKYDRIADADALLEELLELPAFPQQQEVREIAADFYYRATPLTDDKRRWLGLFQSRRATMRDVAEENLEELQALDRTSAGREELTRRMMLYFRIRRPDLADRVATRLLELFPGDAEAHYMRAEARMADKRYDEAALDIDALGDKPEVQLPLKLNLAISRKDYAESAKLFRQLEEKYGDKVMPQLYLHMLVAAEGGRDVNLLNHCWAMLAKRKLLGDPVFANSVGYVAAELNVRLPEAEKLIRAAVKAEPKNGAYLDSLAWVLYRQGKYQDAEIEIRKALEVAPEQERGVLYDHAGDILLKLGKKSEAKTFFRKALKEDDSELDQVKVREKLKQL